MLQLAEETEHLARLVAAKRGATPEDVVRQAVEQQARDAGVLLGPRLRSVDLAKIDAITARSARRPILDHRTAKQILDDEWGGQST